MAESYLSTQQDVRTFGAQTARLLDDLNRPDLQNIAVQYLQDAMRYFQRRPFFFSETDNATVPVYANATNYPQGSTIQASLSGNLYTIVALNSGLSGAAGTPAFPTTSFTVPTSGLPPPASGTAGTVDDNGGPPTGIRWATVGLYTAGSWSQLATVYRVNQYTPPIDYAMPVRIEITTVNLRRALQRISYPELRNYDVIRPAPMTSYPTFWAYFQGQIYLWPYPNGFYAMTLSYRAAPTLAVNTADTNFWTTIGERLIRKYAQASIEREVLKDAQAAQVSMSAATEELNALRSQGIQQDNADNAGIPAEGW